MAGFGRRIRLGHGKEKGSGVRRKFVLARFDRSGEERRSRKVGAGLQSSGGVGRERGTRRGLVRRRASSSAGGRSYTRGGSSVLGGEEELSICFRRCRAHPGKR
ncbi:uncharacterized protein M6B38_199570 [Iris pallida]|uniref:Uncharacterized protein n=1 Tax=Iris pallida TaxID=29817 RepID=A0AAX6EAQ1_IRIPA|nr:uncharacterized protein M6B38_199570 [Iris pallida]